MPVTTQPSPASMRAEALKKEYEIGNSSQFCDDPPDWDSADEKDIAKIIDAQTGVKELVEALQKILVATDSPYTANVKCLWDIQRIADQALRNAERK